MNETARARRDGRHASPSRPTGSGGVRALRRALLSWYDGHARALPWRRDRDPYRVWLAEVMLQQTRVAVVMPAYRRFLSAFPTVARLADADEEGVLAAWSGLGYYARARALHRAARQLRDAGLDAFPRSLAEARALPGVGPYTAAAVLSIAYGLPHAAVDGNVNRVLSRLSLLPIADARGEPQRSLARQLLDPRRPGDWNQAIMELGQTVCLPRTPRCENCPLGRLCAARVTGRVHLHPERPARRGRERHGLAVELLHDRAGRLVLERGAFPYLPHLWLPITAKAGVNGDRRSATAPRDGCIGSFRHAIVQRDFAVDVYARRLTAVELRRAARAAEPGVERRVFEPGALDHIGRSTLLCKSLRLLGRS